MSKKLPFSLLPGSWGLKGKTKQRAEAEYYLSGYALAKRIAEIDAVDDNDLKIRQLEVNKRFKKVSDYEYDKDMVEYTSICDDEKDKRKRLLQIDKKHHKVSDYDYDRQMILIDYDLWEENGENNNDILDIVVKKHLLDNDYKHKKISKNVYMRERATLDKKPWVGVNEIDFERDDPKTGFLEFDWNDQFIEFLISHGYQGPTDIDIVDEWYTDLSRNIVKLKERILNNEPDALNRGFIQKEHHDDMPETDYK